MTEEEVRAIVREELAILLVAGLREVEAAISEYFEGAGPVGDLVLSIVRGLAG